MKKLSLANLATTPRILGLTMPEVFALSGAGVLGLLLSLFFQKMAFAGVVVISLGLIYLRPLLTEKLRSWHSSYRFTQIAAKRGLKC